MKLAQTNKTIKCDSVLCHNLSTFKIESNSYKGDMFLCDKCFKELTNIIKKGTKTNESKQQ